MGFFSWIIFGALVGWVASKLAGTDSQQGALLNIILGIAGALLGGFAYGLLTGDDVTLDWSIGSFLIALLGGVAVSWGWAFFTRKA